jgi:hypothetical protein
MGTKGEGGDERRMHQMDEERRRIRNAYLSQKDALPLQIRERQQEIKFQEAGKTVVFQPPH